MRIVTANFAGAAYPPGTKVSFITNTGGTLHGTVQGLLPQRAQVATQQGTLWKVPYSLLTVTEFTHKPAMSLTEVAARGKQLIREHEDNSGLKAGWHFAFDLAPARGGSCRYSDQQITLSVTYCLKASKAEIVDTILHEIAHAIVGPKHGHDATWKAAARQIGCTAERCHRLQHTPPRWHGQCGCGQQWERQRLSQRIRTSRCGKCKGNIEWKRVAVSY
jgi:predicted SprT family Zn-dependent metalloprotease